MPGHKLVYAGTDHSTRDEFDLNHARPTRRNPRGLEKPHRARAFTMNRPEQIDLFAALGLDTIEVAPYVDKDGNRQTILWTDSREDKDHTYLIDTQ